MIWRGAGGGALCAATMFALASSESTSATGVKRRAGKLEPRISGMRDDARMHTAFSQ
jgi:hypothetical protein